jgi:molecular chaperone DnaK (HSP70)
MIICGLDFGTSNSAIAVVRGGEAAMCPCLERRRIRRVAHIQSNDDSRSRDKSDDVLWPACHGTSFVRSS